MFWLLVFSLQKQFVFYTYSTSQFRPTTFQVLSSHIWVVAIILVQF